MTRGPIVLGELYAAVVGDSLGCQCAPQTPGGCGESHKSTGGACLNAHHPPARPLLVVPIDPTLPAHLAVSVQPGDLIALCRGCLATRTTLANRARRQQLAEAAADSQQSLF